MKRCYLIILISLFGFAACKKPADRRCFKKAGNTATLNLLFDNFEKIDLGVQLDFELVQDSTHQVEIIGGENLIGHVSVTLDNGVLKFRNLNKCNLFRDFDEKIKVIIHFKNLNKIQYDGSERLTSRGQINLPFMEMNINQGAGSADLDINADYFGVALENGYGKLNLKGSANQLNIYALDNRRVDATGLVVANSVNVQSETSGEIAVNVNGTEFTANCKGFGNVLYKGTPVTLNKTEDGEGKVLAIN